ncbi:hypothetical protein [Salinicola sp. CPA57]|nr:hypothetical protein [Salinicola sp. CPA57]
MALRVDHQRVCAHSGMTIEEFHQQRRDVDAFERLWAGDTASD